MFVRIQKSLYTVLYWLSDYLINDSTSAGSCFMSFNVESFSLPSHLSLEPCKGFFGVLYFHVSSVYFHSD